MAKANTKESPKPPQAKIYLLSQNKKIEVKDDLTLEINGEAQITTKKDDEQEITMSPKEIEAKALSEMRNYYQEKIKKSPIQNLVILTGSGSSYNLGKSNGPKGMTMAGLWDELSKNKEVVDLDKFCKDCEFPQESIAKKDLESLLTHSTHYNRFKKSTELDTSIKKIETFIFKSCSLQFEQDSVPFHLQFLNKITKRRLNLPRVKLFTTNYDTLFEQAASMGRFFVLDGFSFSSPRKFNGRLFDFDIVLREGSRLRNENNFMPKVFHLYKMHGSVDWLSINKEVAQVNIDDIERLITENDELKKKGEGKDIKRVMIYPRDSKFELSYEQPYFEMIAKFQQVLREENTLIITIGFSFSDKHISTIILESLKQNPSLHLMVVTYPNIVANEFLQEFSVRDERILLISETFESFSDNYPDSSALEQEDYLSRIYEVLNQNSNGK